MARGDTIPTSLRTALDGYDVERGFGHDCPGCDREYTPGDRLVVTTERRSGSDEWAAPSVVCSDCGRRSFSSGDRRPDVDQALVSVTLAVTPMALVLDGDSARLLDRSPAADG